MKKKILTFAALSILAIGTGAGVMLGASPNVDSAEAANNGILYRNADLAAFANTTTRKSLNVYDKAGYVNTTQTDGSIFKVDTLGGSTYNNQWSWMCFGKTGASSSPTNQLYYVETAEAIDQPIINIGAYLKSYKEASNNKFVSAEVFMKDATATSYPTTPAGQVTFKSNPGKDTEIIINISNPQPNQKYLLNFSFTMGGKSGFARFTDINYYKSEEVVNLTGITATVKPNVDLYAGNAITQDDIEVKATYSNGATKVITNATLPTTLLTEGANTLTISYTEDGVTKECTLEVNALKARVATGIKVTADWTNKVYYTSSTWDTSSLKVEIVYDDASVEDISYLIDNPCLDLQFVNPDTLETIANPTAGLTSVGVVAMLTDAPDFPGLELDNMAEPSIISGFTVNEVVLNLIWYDYVNEFQVGKGFELTGTLKARYNDKRPDVILTQEDIELYLDGTAVNLTTYKFTSNDNGKNIKLYYTDGTLEAFTKEVAITVSNNVTATMTVSSYATKNNWSDGSYYLTMNIDENVTVTFNGTDNGYYSSGSGQWRNYQNKGDGTFTVSVAPGNELKSITFSFSISKTGALYSDAAHTNKISSDTKIDGLSGTTTTFYIGNTKSTVDNGQIRFESFSVVYTPADSASLTELVNTWANTYLFMEDASFNGDGSGKCASEGLYLAAKTALAELEQANPGVIDELKTNETLANAKARYEAWARANYDVAPYDGKTTIQKSNAIASLNNDVMIASIIGIAVLSLTAIGIFTLTAKRKRTN